MTYGPPMHSTPLAGNVLRGRHSTGGLRPVGDVRSGAVPPGGEPMTAGGGAEDDPPSQPQAPGAMIHVPPMHPVPLAGVVLRDRRSAGGLRPVGVGGDGTVARDDLSLRGARDGGGEVGAAGAGSAGGPVRTRSGRQHRPRLCFHVDWHACADDVELRSATAASTTAEGQPTAGVGAATAVSDAATRSGDGGNPTTAPRRG